MKVSAKGNVVTITTDINKEDYARFKNQGVFTVTDENYDQVYKLSHSVESAQTQLSAFSIQTNSVQAGKLASTIILSDDSDIQAFIEDITPELMALQTNEAIMLEKLAKLSAQYAEVLEAVEIEE